VDVGVDELLRFNTGRTDPAGIILAGILAVQVLRESEGKWNSAVPFRSKEHLGMGQSILTDTGYQLTDQCLHSTTFGTGSLGINSYEIFELQFRRAWAAKQQILNVDVERGKYSRTERIF
jgi:hypothetical protein